MLVAEPITLIWYISHGILFVWFSIFMSPIQHSDRANVTYFWTVSFSTLLLLISSISHAPRLIHSNSSRIVDIVAFAWTALPLTAIMLDMVSKVSRRIVGYSITAPTRVFLSNTLLVTIALSLQYMTCIEHGFYESRWARGRGWMLDVPRLHCDMMESPGLFPVPIILTACILFALSQLTAKLIGYKFFQYRYRRNVDSGLPGPVQFPMVPWFSLSLTTTAIQLLVTLKMFVGRLDVRHILTALCREEAGSIVFDQRNSEWVDFFADGGDGFNSTYAVARMLAQPNLKVAVPKHVRQKCLAMSGTLTPTTESARLTRTVTSPVAPPRPSKSSVVMQRGGSQVSLTGDTLVLPRAGVVVHGGDLAYPRPNHETYRARFIGPIEAAFPKKGGIKGGFTSSTTSTTSSSPSMFIVPGNHDWYDGLEAFVHWVVGKGSVGGWRLPQRSSYFALQLRAGWWVLGVDLGLNNDLDVFQHQTMAKILTDQVKEDDKVVLVCHRPQWVFDPYTGELTGELFHQLIDQIGPSRLAMRLAGDIHHYSRFSAPGLPHLVISGGAGAFLHPTHVPDEDIVHQYFDMQEGEGASVETCERDDEEEEEEERNVSESGKNGGFTSKIPFFKDNPAFAQSGFYRYRRSSTYPSESTSRRLAWLNPLHFRDRNWGADIVLGTVYVCVGVSVLPLCESAAHVVRVMEAAPTLSSSVLNGFLALVFSVVIPAMRQIWLNSYFSCGSQILFLVLCVSASKAHSLLGRIAIGSAHWICHVVAAVTIFASIEVGIAFLASVSGGRDSVLSDGFRVPGLVTNLDSTLFGQTPILASGLGHFLRFIDVPSSLIRNRALLCEEGGLWRELMFRYLSRVLPFFWLIATPVAAWLMGCYLLVNVNWLGLHFNEAFSSLRIEDYKNFVRMHIDADGDLHCYVVGLDRVPRDWEQDPAWDPSLFGALGQPTPPSHRWVTPSRWRPKGSQHSEPTLVDYFIVKPSQ